LLHIACTAMIVIRIAAPRRCADCFRDRKKSQ
jgi:hypothetical protein